jgi:hypothetical protein
MRICFIGNSHLGHAGRAVRALLKDTPHEADLFIERSYGTEPLAIRHGDGVDTLARVPVDPRSGTEVRVQDYDAFVVVGLMFSLIRQVERSVDFQRDTYRGPRRGQIASEAMYQHYLDGLFDETKARLVLDILQRATDRPAWLIPQPLPLSWVRERTGERFEVFGDLYASGEVERTLADFHRQTERVRERGVQVLPQPESTVVDGMFTRDEFGLADPRDQTEKSFYRRGDFYHMNADYGREQMQSLFGRMGLS